jgi:hypothetical protein
MAFWRSGANGGIPAAAFRYKSINLEYLDIFDFHAW